MRKGGKRLARVKKTLEDKIEPGVSAWDIEKLANELIAKEGGKPSFKMVEGYSWATCVNVNSGLVHGVPGPKIIFKKGDVVSVDVGMFYKGFHTDTSITVGIDVSRDVENFLEVGKRALARAIDQARVGNYIYDISRAIEDTIEEGGFIPIRALVGHGVGRELHEDPQIPCFVPGDIEASPRIEKGMVLAIEVMYTMGNPDVVSEADGWTISTRDGKISALFEDTVVVTQKVPELLTV